MQLFVGSLNPVKINAVTQAASETWPAVRVTGVDVPSGVPSQPWGDEQTRAGARNRAAAALDDGLRQLQQDGKRSPADDAMVGIGLEGGVFELDDQVWSTVWVVVTDQQGEWYESNGARFRIPDPIATQLRNGGELGPLFAKLSGEHNVKQGRGAIGILTNNFIDRTEEYAIIVKLSLGLWYGRDWNS